MIILQHRAEIIRFKRHAPESEVSQEPCRASDDAGHPTSSPLW